MKHPTLLRIISILIACNLQPTLIRGTKISSGMFLVFQQFANKITRYNHAIDQQALINLLEKQPSSIYLGAIKNLTFARQIINQSIPREILVVRKKFSTHGASAFSVEKNHFLPEQKLGYIDLFLINTKTCLAREINNLAAFTELKITQMGASEIYIPLQNRQPEALRAFKRLGFSPQVSASGETIFLKKDIKQ